MITIQAVYVLVGALFVVFAVLSVRDTANPRRWTTGLFWALFAASFLAGDFLGDFGNGVLVFSMALIAGFGGLGMGKVATTTAEERQAGAARRGNALFVPALIIPLVTVVGTILIKGIELPGVALGPSNLIASILEAKQATLISLAAGAVVATIVALAMFRQPLASPFQEGRRLMDVIGWAALLPQMLASLARCSPSRASARSSAISPRNGSPPTIF